MKDWSLRIYSWQGMALAAWHTYGELIAPDGSEEKLKRRLTRKEAIELNKVVRHYYPNKDEALVYLVEPGQLCGQFNDRDEVIEEAIKQFLSRANPGSQLIDAYINEIVYATK